jgi:coatomer subunit beta'
MSEEALEIATDADYKFDLAVQLGKLEVAKVLNNLLSYQTIERIFYDVLFVYILNLIAIYCNVQAIAIEAQSESKWKQLGELAMSTGKVGSYFFEIYDM